MLRGNLGRNTSCLCDSGKKYGYPRILPDFGKPHTGILLLLLPQQRNGYRRALARLGSHPPQDECVTLRIEVSGIAIDYFPNYFAGSGGNAMLVHNGPECFPKPVGVRKGHSYPQGMTDYTARKAYRSAVAEAEYTVHGHKHLKASTEAEAMAFSRGGGAAQYLPVVSNSGLEKIALQKGYVIERGGGYYAYIQFDRTIGYNNGNATTWIRAELSGDAYHGHPVLESDLPQAVRKHFGL